MVRIIDVCSGKGGVGKTTVTANLGLALQNFGKKVAVVDCNLTTSHLSLLFGSYNYPVTLNNFLRNEAMMEDVVYTHPSGIHIVPASLELTDIVDLDFSLFKTKLRKVFENFDLVLLDSAPGLGREALISLQVADEVLFVANPYITSLVDVVKLNQLIKSLPERPQAIGIVLNRVRGKNYEIGEQEITQFTGLPVLGCIPEDELVLESTNKGSLVTFYRRNAKSSKAFFKLAARMLGVSYVSEGLLQRIKDAIFRRSRSVPCKLEGGLIG